MKSLVPFTWDGDHMVPRRGFQATCDKQFVVGEVYRLTVQEERSANSHRHYFAQLYEVWQNLPDHLAARFNSPEKLRKFALIKCGYCHEKKLAMATPDEAKSLAAYFNEFDAFAIVAVEDCVVTIYTAQSQSLADMDKTTFQQSKEAVLDYVSELVGIARKTLDHEASLAPSHSDERTRSPVG